MDLKIFSEYFKTFWPICLLAYICTISGAAWIDSLYTKELKSDLLSFPKQIAQRAKFRKPLLFLLLAICAGKTGSLISLPAFYYIFIAIVLLSYITVTDFEQYVIFDAMLLPLALCGVVYTVHMQLPLWNHIAAGLGGGLSFLLLTLLTHGAIGGGDIKLIAALGLWLGVRPLLSVIAYGFIAGGVAALFFLITKQKKRHDYFAYGPYFALSGIGILLGWIRQLF